MENTRTEKTARMMVAIRALAIASVILPFGRVCAQLPTTVLQPEHVTIHRHDTHRDSEGTFQYDTDGALVQYHETCDDDYNEYNISYDEERNVSVIDRKMWVHVDDLKYPYFYGRRYLFSYDAFGRIDRMEQLYHDVHNFEYWVSDKLWTPLYDDDGRLAMDTMLAVHGFLEDDMPYEFLWRHDYAFGDGTRETLYTNYETGGTLRTIKVAETYNEDGKLSTAIEQRLTNENFVNNKRWDYTYNGGLAQSITKRTWDGSAWQNDMLTLFTYDADGNLTMKESRLWDGESFGNDRRTRIVLNEAGLPHTVLFEQWNDGSWTEGSTDGLLRFVGDHILGKRLADFLLENRVDGDHWLSFLGEFYTEAYVSRIDFTYVETTVPPYHVGEATVDKEDTIQIQPNPTAGVVTVTGDDIAKVEAYNTLGQCILSIKASEDMVTVDLTGQPSGLYFITATDRNGQRSVRKVIRH